MLVWPLAALLALSPPSLAAQDTITTADSTDADSVMHQFEAALHWQTGTVTLKDGLATIVLPPGARFLGEKDAKLVLTKAWGNPPDDGTLGMIFPDSMGPFDEASWAIEISFDEDGYVKDDEAVTLDYTKLLREMQEGVAGANEDRKKEGFATVELLGWAEPPHYDQASHKLFWAKRLQFSGTARQTLNYNIRILGRRGVLVLNAIASMQQLDQVKRGVPALLAAVNFSDGHRYADFNPSEGDRVAAYGITALIAGGIAAKAGLFKGLIVILLAAKKFLIVAAVGGIAWARKLLGRRKDAAAAPGGPTAT